MRYIATAFLYWPIWLAFACYGHSFIGMAAGAALVICVWRALWVSEFGTKGEA
jgi:hypothetical protein